MGCKPKSCICCYYYAPMRHVIAFLCLFAVIVGYTQRVALNITIVEMVPGRSKKLVRACPLAKGMNSTKIKSIKGGVKPWSETEQSHILTSFYFGYAPGHLIVAYLLHKFSTRHVFLAGMILSTLTTALIPVFITYLDHYLWIVLMRVLCGIGQSTLFSSCSALMSRWIPSNERATIGAMVYSGNSLGTILGTLASGMLVKFLNSWPIVFYIWTGVGVLWILLFFLYGYADPTEHPNITAEEKTYLEETIVKKETKPLPLRAILSDPAFWGLLLAQFGNNYILFTILSNIPKYMNTMLNYDIKANALVSSLPHIAQYICSLITGRLADYLIKRKNMNVAFLRKIYALLCILVPSLCCLAIGYSKCNRTMAIGFLVVGLLFKGFFYSGPKVNSLDLTSNFAGTLMAFQNGFGGLSGAISPYVISLVTTKHTFEQWQLVFWIMFALCNTLMLLYLIMGRGKRAKWDYSKEELEALPAEKPKVKWYHQKPDDEFAAALANDDEVIRNRKSTTKNRTGEEKKSDKAKKDQKKLDDAAAKTAAAPK